MTKSEKAVDRRTILRNIKKDILSDKEYKDFLKSLPDDSEEGEAIQIDEDPALEL